MEVAGATSIPVQTLPRSKTPTVPPRYIQRPEHRPGPTSAAATIPLIDLSLSCDAVRGDIAGACREWGAFNVLNHGVPKQLLDEMRTVGSSFSDLNVSGKLKYSCDSSSAASEGYGRIGGITLIIILSPFLAGDPPAGQFTLPIAVPFCGVKRKFDECNVRKSNFLKNITVSYYPPCPQPELTLGLQSHSDIGAMTLLIQDDVSGLEVLKDGEWVIVQPSSDAVVVLLADQTEVITNGEYKSAIHRAITNASRARLSVATFHDPVKTRIISPAPELVAKSAAHCREVLYGDFVTAWYSEGPEGKRNLDAL
ncbi:hypothetical protein Cgig2_009473 [Carnegiea gigantea]|uniref:Fe2OG dioxygenase domain-containing protein n=1 Tax=Carnegiea gigantea TaxID=171969 RepID=A0A9Q1QD15_9CARY|nr:hypothetical protein Cgig2_009473 [Carnegiea gigantea]